MFIDDLKKSILQKAIQGKLIEQNPNDEPASELLKRIKEEKEKLIKDGKIKKEKALSPITDEEKLFDIPESREWVRFGNLTINHDSERQPVSKEDRISNEGTYNYYGATGAIDKVDDYIFDGAYLMIGEDGGNFYTIRDNSFIASGKFWANNHVHVTEPVLVNIKYLKHYLNSLNLPALGLIHGIAVPKLNQANLNGISVALPPLEEQKRIVDKLDELLPLLEEARPLEEEIINLEKEFPNKLRQSLLQFAIQGKLVEQNSGDEPASELLKIILNEKNNSSKKERDDLNFNSMDFPIPKNWEWTNLNTLFDFVDYRGKTPNKIQSGVFLVTASNIRQGYMDYTRKEYISEEEYETRQSRGLTESGDLLFTTEAPMGNVAICDLEKCSCGQRVITFKEQKRGSIIPKLFMYFILSPNFQKQLLDNCTGTTAKGIKAEKLKHFKIPLPPLEEQKRIVAKLDELMKLCDELEEQINLS